MILNLAPVQFVVPVRPPQNGKSATLIHFGTRNDLVSGNENSGDKRTIYVGLVQVALVIGRPHR